MQSHRQHPSRDHQGIQQPPRRTLRWAPPWTPAGPAGLPSPSPAPALAHGRSCTPCRGGWWKRGAPPPGPSAAPPGAVKRRGAEVRTGSVKAGQHSAQGQSGAWRLLSDVKRRPSCSVETCMRTRAHGPDPHTLRTSAQFPEIASGCSQQCHPMTRPVLDRKPTWKRGISGWMSK